MHYPTPLTEDEIRRRRKVEQGEHVRFDLAFCDSQTSGSTFLRDAGSTPSRVEVDAARRNWLADKRTAYRSDQAERSAEPKQQQQSHRQPLNDARSSIAEARRARCARLEEAWRNHG